MTSTIELDEDHPLWLVNEQIKGLLEGLGAPEDHEDVLKFLRATGLPEDTVSRLHRAIVHGDRKVLPDLNMPKKIGRVESGFKGMFLREAQAYKRGWNECRGAMLAAAPEAPK